jgi:hypothetical protein
MLVHVPNSSVGARKIFPFYLFHFTCKFTGGVSHFVLLCPTEDVVMSRFYQQRVALAYTFQYR